MIRREALMQIKGSTTPHPGDRMQTGALTGLSSEEAHRRRAQCGWNEIAAARPSRLLALAKRFWGPSAWMIEAIVVLSLVLQRATDAVIAGGLLIINAVIGYLHERKAEQVIELLKQRLTITARAQRDGHWIALPARDLVPGDVVRVRMGDIAPADMRIRSGELEVDQSLLTGESQAVARRTGELLYSGSLTRQGEATCIVEAIGASTFFGRTIELVRSAAPKLHLDEIVSKLVRWLLLIVAVVLGLFAVVSLAGGAPLRELLPLALVMLMGAVPVALPVMFTVSTAYAARRLAEKGVLVTRLSATEDAASMTHLFLDKTGTITMNRLSVTGVRGFSVAEDDVVRFALAASDEANRDPIDEAVAARAAARFGSGSMSLQRKSFTPFTPRTRRTEATVSMSGADVVVTKGAVEAVIAWCGSPPEAELLRKAANEAGQEGARTIAVGVEQGGARQIVGAIFLADPPRPDSLQMISQLRGFGVTTKMLTGDAIPVASAVARQVGLGEIGVLPGGDAELIPTIDRLDGFAQVYPQDKHRVIAACQARGRIVGMTMSTATDAAKAAASVVLTNEGLSGIVDVVRNGREVYERVLTWMINKVSRTVLKTGFVLAAYMLTGHLPISASAMLLVVIGTDFAKIALATDHVRPSERPDDWHVTGYAVAGAVLGVLLTLEAVAIFWGVSTQFSLPFEGARMHTLSFAVLLFLGLFSVLSMRERRRWFASNPSPALALSILAAFAAGATASIAGVPGLRALGLQPVALTALAAAAATLLVNDPVKVLLFGRARPRRPSSRALIADSHGLVRRITDS
jgi:H+-transporting ATPase